LTTKKTYVSEVFPSEITGKPVVVIGTPIFNNNNSEVIGIASGVVNFSKVLDLISQISTTHNSYAFITSKKGLILAHPDRNLTIKANLFDIAQIDKDQKKIIMKEKRKGFIDYIYKGQKKFLYFAHDFTFFEALNLIFNQTIGFM